jgi:glycosyltransferase involved in cell wall biosynthesis
VAEQALTRKRIAAPEPVIRIGYLSGTRTHQHDFEIVAEPLLQLMQDYPQVRLVICGYLDLPADFQPFAARIERHKFMPWQRLITLSATLDINIAPLDLANELNQAKSALKYFEAAAVQVLTVASPVEDFHVAITHGQNGLLATTADDWFACLKELIERPDYRVLLGENAHADALDRYTTAAQSSHTLDIFRAIA